jgi:hypothetical protein
MFGTPSSDDRETPITALSHVAHVLRAIKQFNKNPGNTLEIYDPYYCKGAMKDRLCELGFDKDSIHNDPVNCYTAQKNGTVPQFDVLLSNPPFSGDHVKRSVGYAMSCKRPWALLLPSNVFLRDWFTSLPSSTGASLMYLAPHERYAFEANLGAETTKHIPLVTMWFIGGVSSALCDFLMDQCSSALLAEGATLSRTVDDLPKRIRKLLPYAKVLIITLCMIYDTYAMSCC